MRNVPRIAVASTLTLLLFAPALAAETEEEVPDYLVTVTAQGGASLTAISETSCFSLTLTGADHVVWFTDRPEREAHGSHAKLLVENWDKAFATAAPNADLEMFGEDGIVGSVILTLEGAPEWDTETKVMTFPKACAIELEGDLPQDHGVGKAATEAPFAALFIDGAKLFHWNACYGPPAETDHTPVCVEQWGSYPAKCFPFLDGGDTAELYPGKRCHDFCIDQDYCSSDSWLLQASTYHCSGKYYSGSG